MEVEQVDGLLLLLKFREEDVILLQTDPKAKVISLVDYTVLEETAEFDRTSSPFHQEILVTSSDKFYCSYILPKLIRRVQDRLTLDKLPG